MSGLRVMIVGGYGTFGRLVADELSKRGVTLTIAGRNENKAHAASKKLGEHHNGVRLDLAEPAELPAAIRDHHIVVNCAGPFSAIGTVLLDACMQTGCHHIDLADDRQYVAAVRAKHELIREKRLAAVFGCSSLPALSGCAADLAIGSLRKKPTHIQVTLFIGNNNPKGVAAVQSASQLIGRTISAPQGDLIGFGEAERISLPSPFGKQTGMNFESPEYDLFGKRFGVANITVKVAFESNLVCTLFRMGATAMPKLGRWLMPRLAPLSGVLRFIGTSGGAVMSEVFVSPRHGARSTILSEDHGQRMAIMPCVYAVESLLERPPRETGAITAYELLSSRLMFDRLTNDGYRVETEAF